MNEAYLVDPDLEVERLKAEIESYRKSLGHRAPSGDESRHLFRLQIFLTEAQRRADEARLFGAFRELKKPETPPEPPSFDILMGRQMKGFSPPPRAPQPGQWTTESIARKMLEEKP
ncbi:MAG: hypothetical protein JW929_16290 [Anaerolineales bacterium]|nr:hypothetical protein [Anaerolineales bacterium]